MIRRTGGLIGVMTALGLIASASAARASYLLFTYAETGPGAIDASWDQSSNPTPIMYNYETYTTVPVLDWAGNVGPYTFVTYISVVFESGGLYTPDGSINLYGQQFYGPPESSPSFAPNVWTGVNATDGLPFTLTITSTDIPEPSDWTLLLMGMGAAGAAMRLARRKTSAERLRG